MKKEINFTESEGGSFVASWTSTGAVTVQVERTKMRPVVVLANIPGMKPTVVARYENPYGNSVIFGVDLPVGVEVSIEVGCEVVQAMAMDKE